MKKIAFSFGLFAMIIACSPKTTPVVEEVKSSEFPNEVVAKGSELYHSDCIKCHNDKGVKNFSREAWNHILPEMAKKAKLASDQQAAVDAYINFILEK